MKKLLLVMLIGFGAAMLVKNGQVTVSPDRQIMVVGYPVPLPDAVQNSPVLAMMLGQLPNAPSRAGGSPASAAARPALPIVNSANGSFDPNVSGSLSSSRGGPATGAEGFSAAAKALRGSQ
jgi:hypothetical protein